MNIRAWKIPRQTSRGYYYTTDVEVAKKTIGAIEVRLFHHHTALSRGYIGVKGSYWTDYQGRYGSGLQRHISTLYTPRLKGNSYHGVEYWLESKH